MTAGWGWVDTQGHSVVGVAAALDLQAGWTESWEMGLPPAVHHVRGLGCRAAAGPWMTAGWGWVDTQGHSVVGVAAALDLQAGWVVPCKAPLASPAYPARMSGSGGRPAAGWPDL